jgi:glucosamine-6-phosphate deaminase
MARPSGPIKLVVVEDYPALSRAAAEFIADELDQRPDLLVLAATGDTPMGPYRTLADMAKAGEIDPARLSVAQLDEYVDVAPSDRRSLFGWMTRALVDPLGISPSRVLGFDADCADPELACQRYGRTLLRRKPDLAVLGLGPNGHLGFNEPPSESAAPTRVVDLSPASIVSNSRYWGSTSQVPGRALTVGMDVILASRKILLVVSGRHKADILRRALVEEATPYVPASLLRLASDVTVITDRQAWPWRTGDVTLPAELEFGNHVAPAMTRSAHGGS